MTAFNYICPHCKTELEFDEDPTGQSFDCINCGKRFTVYAVNTHNKKRRAPKPSMTKEERKRLSSCYFYGLIFGVIGIFIAHMTDGNEGARAAARGFLLQFILAAGGFIVICLAPAIAGLISK